MDYCIGFLFLLVILLVLARTAGAVYGFFDALGRPEVAGRAKVTQVTYEDPRENIGTDSGEVTLLGPYWHIDLKTDHGLGRCKLLREPHFREGELVNVRYVVGRFSNSPRNVQLG